MSNTIFLSDTPPPLVPDDDDFEDEFGDFKGPEELSFDNEMPSTPTSLKNSRDHFTDNFTDFTSLTNGESRYEIFDTDKMKNTSSLPPVDYFSPWEQIETNTPEFINIDQKQESNEAAVCLNNEEPKNLGVEVVSIENGRKNSMNEDLKEFEDGAQIARENLEEIPNNNSSIDSFKSIEDNSESEFSIPETKYSDKIPDINESQIIQNEIVPSNSSDSSKKLDVEENNNTDIKDDEKYSNEENKDSSKASSFHIAEDDLEESPGFSVNFNNKDEIKSSPILENQMDQGDFDEFADFSSCTFENDDNQKRETNIESTEDEFLEFGSYQNTNVSKSDDPTIEPFGTPIKISETTQKESHNIDEFDDFTSYSTHEENSVEKDENDKFDDFACYSTHKGNHVENDEFDDFSSFSTHKKTSLDNDENDNDEFDDFACYSTDKVNSIETNKIPSEGEVLKICKTPEEASKETQIVLEKIFPKIECTTSDYLKCDYITNNSVFENLKDITETNALTYQWDKSISQKNILKTLNIDVRNILYGPTWNSGVPIFAANLCAKPLEPIKSELPIPVSPQKISESQETAGTMSQFDWSGSGLSNLQDSLGTVSSEGPKNPQEAFNEEPEILQPSYTGIKTTSKKDFEDTLSNVEVKPDDFSDFTSYQKSEEKDTRWDNMMPLRESYISSNKTQEPLETDEISKYFQELTTGKIEASGLDRLVQSSKRSSKDSITKSSGDEQFSFESHSVYIEQPEVIPDQRNSQNNPVKIVSLDSGKSNCDILTNSSSFEFQEQCFEKTHPEDEFTDFQSSIPCPSKVVEPVLLEPLKPSVLQPEHMKHQPLKIEWPEPGLDEEEINRIVNGVLRKNSTHENVTEKLNREKVTESHPDNDDWSDFMSVKEPLKKRTSTPDLPLSVFNLGSIQSNRVSAPYVAPNGVVHSPSKTASLPFPLLNRNVHSNSQHHPQPFITSQAFNALYSNTKNTILLPNTHIGKSSESKSNHRCAENEVQRRSSSIIDSNAEDDDWGDFVSAPSTISKTNSNFFQSTSYVNNLGLGVSGAPFKKSSMVSKNTVVRQERNNLPIISTMPDLDFVSPKYRSTKK